MENTLHGFFCVFPQVRVRGTKSGSKLFGALESGKSFLLFWAPGAVVPRQALSFPVGKALK
ncbi:MAG: hypothetical protein IPH04_18930 [Saprospirales bacterium]|nr:hypothetical protein [Saprospirales bacterium]